MTDEGQRGEPMDDVELAHAMVGMAATSKQMYDSLVGEGFDKADALKLTAAFLHGAAGGKLS